jgi:uncharacterized protein YutE (UPF0331/DUF86 family)
LVDEALILRKLAQLDMYQSQIEGYRQISSAQYRVDWKTQRIVERTLQLMIELCVDIANHVISDRQLQVPSSYANAFEVLNQADLVSGDLTKTMVQMAKFRNILVHQYAEVDAEIVVGILQSRLGDFVRFREELISALKGPAGTGQS